MREILYVQAGNFANYVGTHFWNAQESYFTYSDDEETTLNHDISFREGSNPKVHITLSAWTRLIKFQGDPTYCPRLLSFDRKANFGALSQTNDLYDNESTDDSQLWQGEVAGYGPVPKEPHAYQTYLKTDEASTSSATDFTNNIRYWSDFNRVFYVPRTIQMLPDVPDWQETQGDWLVGQEMFQRYNEETELMEGSVRLFIEECNSFQGLQIMSDASTFASFSVSFLMAFNDELSRAPCLSFPLMGNAVPRNIDLENTLHIRKVVSDAVYLRELDSLSSLTVPILNPNTWTKGSWDVNLKIDSDYYYTSSILSAHIESSTLPLRLKTNVEDIASFSGHLNLHGSHRFSQLMGVFPVAASVTPQDFWQQSYNFSISRDTVMAKTYTRRDVTRGLSASALKAYNSWCSQQAIQQPYALSTHAPAYPLPSSFPDIFRDEGILANHRKGQHERHSSASPSTTSFTSLRANSGTATMVAEYAKYAQACVDRRKTGLLPGLIETLDDVKELVNDLWTIHDAYSDSDSDTYH